MEMYNFITRWEFDAPIEKVWEVLIEEEATSKLSPSFKKIQTENEASRLEIGSKTDYEVKGRLPYSLKFSLEVKELIKPKLLVVSSEGDLIGTGRWELESLGEKTKVIYYWDVGTSSFFLNLLAKLKFVKGLMIKNHDQVMAEAYENLKRAFDN